MDWIKILEIVLSLLGNCRTNRTREEVVKSVTELGPFERLALRLHFKKLGYTKEQVKEAMSIVEGFTTDPDDANEIVAAAEEQVQATGQALKGNDAVAPVVALLALLWLPATSSAASFLDTLLPPLVIAEVETDEQIQKVEPAQRAHKEEATQKEDAVQKQPATQKSKAAASRRFSLRRPFGGLFSRWNGRVRANRVSRSAGQCG